MLFIVIIVTFLIGSLLGYLIHRFIHMKMAGKLYEMHMAHHLELYPSSDYLSDEYRNAGSNDSLIIFLPILAFFILSVAIILWLCGMSLGIIAIMLVESALIGYLNDKMHGLFHIRGTYLEKFSFFVKLRDIHYVHHVDMSKNFGIFSFIWDKIFKTFKVKP